jgi:MFS transporter, PPP family, 3-phenylpropionic acid transporter
MRFGTRSRFKLFYLVQYLGVGVYFPYLALYLLRREMSGAELGILLAVVPLVSIIAQPVWCVIGDVYNIRRALLSLASLALAVSTGAFFMGSGFPWLLFCMILVSAVSAPLGALGTALTLEYLETQGQQHEYGLLRLWGSIGFSISALLMGGLFIGQFLPLLPLVYGLLNACTAGLVWTLPKNRPHAARDEKGTRPRMVVQPEILLMGVAALVIGATLSIGQQYLSVFLADIQASGWLIGGATALQAIAEVPLMAGLPRFVRRWGLTMGVMVGVVLLPLRWLILAIVVDPIWALPAQVLHSTAIVSLYVAGVLLLDSHFEKQWRATVQGLYAVALNGLGPTIGLMIAGSIYEGFGSRSLWVVNMGVALVGGLIMVVALKKISAPRAVETESGISSTPAA